MTIVQPTSRESTSWQFYNPILPQEVGLFLKCFQYIDIILEVVNAQASIFITVYNMDN